MLAVTADDYFGVGQEIVAAPAAPTTGTADAWLPEKSTITRGKVARLVASRSFNLFWREDCQYSTTVSLRGFANRFCCVYVLHFAH